jgi:imidazolonepropionase-like amidohydrolase
MRIWSILRWSSLGAFTLAGVGIAFAYSQGQFPGQPVDGPPIALVGGRVYDPAGDSLIDPATVIIHGREIVAVDPYEPVSDSARVLYVNGLTLLPGFIDSHVHMSGIRSRIPDGSRELGWLRYLWKFIRRFPERRQVLIESGITTVKSLGDPYPWIVKLGERIERHELAGPRIFASGPYLTAPGGHPVSRFRRAGQGDTSFIAQVTRQLAGPADAVIAVNRISRRVHFVSAVLERRDNLQLPRMRSTVLRAIAAAAHEQGLRVLAHVSTVGDVLVSLPAGVDGIEHVPIDQAIDAVTLQMLRESRVFIDPTLQATEQLLGELLRDTAAARLARTNTELLHAAGVPLVAGSDAPSPGTTFGHTFHEELRNLVEVGLTPGEAIAAATSVAAEYLGVSDRLGTIEPGKWADIIAVGGDPLADISAASEIYLVIADGQVLFDRLDEVRRPRSRIAMRSREPHIPGPRSPRVSPR